MIRSTGWALLLVSMVGCVRGAVDRFTTQRVVPAAARVADVDRVCRTGGALGHALGSITRPPPEQAMIIADATAGLCDEAAADQASLEVVLAQRAGDLERVKDWRERERRLRSRAAGRFHSAWLHTQGAFGELGDRCPKIREKDELTFLVGLLSGTLAMLHDKASGGTHQVPLDTLNRVGRAALCVDGWWHTPASFEAAAWAVVPGSGPDGIDPWQQLHRAARSGSDEGMRLGWALLAVVADNAGREDDVRAAIQGAADSLGTPAPADYVLFDRYALDLLQLQADRRWIAERGHRVQGLSLPQDPAEVSQPPIEGDPFKDDPFAGDGN